jgi:hypothetical protein
MSKSKYQFTEDMNEISGFGGGYEAGCRAMIVAGMEWFDLNPTATPKYKGYKEVFGICMEDNTDAKALSAAMIKACHDCTGAMHHCCVMHVFKAREMGWGAYCTESRKRRAA